jgi:hypothetical protein
MPDPSPLARAILHALEAGPRTVDEVAATAKVPIAVAGWTLAGLRSAGEVDETAPDQWALRRRPARVRR